MPDPTASPPDNLQFDRAEFAGTPATNVCRRCGATINATYFMLERDVLCEACAGRAGALQSAGSPFGRALAALLLGLIGGAIGAGIYYGVAAITGYEIGLVALVVGLMVGGAVRIGSRTRGGWFYQLMAIGLTYISIGAAYSLGAVLAMPESSPTSTATQDAGDAATSDEIDAALHSPAGRIFVFVVFMFIAPIAANFESPIGFVILAFALFEAWRINRGRGPIVTGPYSIVPQAPPTAPPFARPPLPRPSPPQDGGPHV